MCEEDSVSITGIGRHNKVQNTFENTSTTMMKRKKYAQPDTEEQYMIIYVEIKAKNISFIMTVECLKRFNKLIGDGLIHTKHLSFMIHHV